MLFLRLPNLFRKRNRKTTDEPTTEEAMNPFRFLDLFPELRDIIYDPALGDYREEVYTHHERLPNVPLVATQQYV